MAAYDLEEQEQLAEIKAWWKQYGNLLTNVLLAAVLAFCGLAGLELVSAQPVGQAGRCLQRSAKSSSGQGLAEDQGGKRRIARKVRQHELRLAGRFVRSQSDGRSR
jgi:predicted negative regulator of RcsB-dependent stress response